MGRRWAFRPAIAAGLLTAVGDRRYHAHTSKAFFGDLRSPHALQATDKRDVTMSRANPRFRRVNPALPPATPNLFELVVIGEIENQLTINTLYYADGGAALITASEANLIAGWRTAFESALRAAISVDWVLVQYKCQCLTSPARIPQYSAGLSLPGTGPTPHEPTTVCVTIKRGSLVKGQAGRGRISLPGVPTAWVTGSQINATGLTAIGPFASDLASGFVSVGVTYVSMIVSRKNRAGPPLGASPVLTATIDDTLGSCRRRKLGRGK